MARPSISPERKISPVSASRPPPSAREAKTSTPESPEKPITIAMKVSVRLAASAASSSVP